MKQKIILLAAFFTLNFLSLKAQFPTDVNYQTISENVPAIPNLNVPYIDNSVPDPISMVRITEFVPNWNWYPTHEYAKIQPWNADESVYKFYSVAIYDADTHQIIRQLPGSQIYPSYWSNTDADVLYGFQEDGSIISYSVANDVVTSLDQIQGYEKVVLGPGEGNIDKYDHHVAFIGKAGTNMDVIVYDLQNLQIAHTETFLGAWGNGTSEPQYVDWVSISQSGDYVGIMWNHNNTSENNPFNGHFGVEIYNAIDMQFQRRIAAYGNHGDFGYAQNGDEVFVQFWGETGTVNMYYLDRMERVVLSNNTDFAGEGHISCRSLNRPGWAYVSQDDTENTGVIVAIKLDNSGIVEYFGHHFSSSSSYLKSPMPCPNPNGDKIMFKTDYNQFQNTDEIYEVIAAKSANLNVLDTSFEGNFTCNNPVTDFLQIHSDSVEIKEIKLINALGSVVKNRKNISNKEVKMDLSAIENGIYFLIINEQYTKKIVLYK
ncbi:MAG TPA: T9SS type A sorting domain-containing protein [Flavobacteriia bacterium]|nr:T9SS type A sorting domain-containing protein [Flavobacteriia bacterium]